MKPSKFTNLFAATGLLLAASLWPASAGIIKRANVNTGLLTTTNCWVGAVVPGSGDIALWDFTVSTAADCTNGLGSNTNWGGIALRNPNTTVAITNVSPYVLTLGASGIDLSLASVNLVLGCPVTLGASQTWTVETTHTNFVMNTLNFGTNTLTISPYGSGQVVLANTDTGTGGLTKSGTGSLSLTNTQGYTGPTTVAAGTLVVDFTELGGDNLVNPNSTLTLAGGTNSILAQGSSTDNQTFNGLALGGGGATFLPNSESGTLNVTLGAITRSVGGAVDITPQANGNLNVTTTNNLSGILGGWATVNGFSDWATNNASGLVAAYAGYQSMPATGGTTNDNDLVDGTVTALAGALVANSVKIGAGTALDLAGNTLTLNGTAGGWLAPSSFTLNDSVGTGVFGAGPTNELIVGVASGKTVTVNATLVGNGTAGQLTKVGPGTMVIGSSNSFSGTTIVGAGTLTVGNNNNLGSVAGNVALNGGNLYFNRNDAAIISPVGGTITINSPASAIKNTGTPAGGTNVITLAGGIQNMDSIWNSSPGTLEVNASGTYNLFGANLLKVNGSGSVMILNGGTYNLLANAELNGNSASSWMYVEGGNINANNLNGNNGGFTLYNCNFQLDSGSVHVTTGRFSMGNANGQVLNINGGSLAVDNTSGGGFYGMRLGNEGGASSTGGYSITVNQTGGVVSVTPTNGNTSGIDLGTEGPSGAADTYNLSGGTLAISNNANLGIGADTGGTVTTTFNQTGGNLFVSGTIQGDQGAGALQVFSLTGGTCTFNTCTATSLRDTATDAAGTLVNNGGTLVPGGVGIAGKMTITGNLSVPVSTAVLALDIGGKYQATTFQAGPTNYDFVSVSGNATLGGVITVNLLNGFVPAANNSFTNLTVGSSGTLTVANLNASMSGYIPVYTNGVLAPGNYFRAVASGKNLILTNYSAVPAPVASFTPTNAIGAVPFPVQFVDASSGAITNRSWNFGDGATTNTQITTLIHTYTNVGVYTVKLTVSTAEGLTSSQTGKVTVVTPGGTLTWVGNKSNAWDLTTTNWMDALSNPYKYADGDGVIFDDTSTVTNVTLNFPAAPNSLDFNNYNNQYTISGSGGINGATYLNVNNSGSLTMLTVNNYLGETTVNGTLQLGNGVLAGCSIDNSSAITDNGLLVFNQPDNHTIAATINGGGALTKAGAGTLTLMSANNSFSGPVTINGGVLSAADYTGFGYTSTLNLSGGGMAQFTAGPSSYYYTINLGAGGGGLANAVAIPSMGTSISGTGPFTKGGNGLMVFDQPPVYTGNTIVTGGTLQLDTGGTSVALPGNIALNGGSLTYERQDTLVQPGVISGNSASSTIINASTANGNTNTLTFADGINNFNNIQNSSSGALVLTGSPNSTNNLAGYSWINGVDGWLSFAGGTYVINGNTLDSGGNATAGISIDGGNVYALGGGGNYWGLGTYPGASLTVNSGLLDIAGRLDMDTANQTLTINGGQLIVTNNPNGGNYGLRFGSVNGSAGAGGVSVTGLQTGGALTVSANNGLQIGSATSGATVSYTLAGGTLTAAAGNSLSLGGSTDGTGTTTFTMTGGKLVVSGTLSGAQAVNTAVQVFSFQGGTLAAYNCVASYLTDMAGNPVGNLVNYGGILAPGDIGTAGETIITGNYNVANSATALDIDLGGTAPANAFQNTNNYDYVAVSGSAVLNGSLNLSEINGFEPIVGQSDTFTILTATNVTGAFTNVASGGRLLVTGYTNRSFLVTVSSTNVVLSGYQTPTVQSYFTQSTNAGAASLTVTFTNLSNGTGLTNFWSFGDGGTSSSTAATVTHTYTSVGTNTVSLTVGSAAGVNTYTVSNAVMVTAPSGPSGPATLTNSVVGKSLVLTWGQGWLLAVQTNPLSVGLGNNWVTNTTATSPFTNTMDPTKGAVFYKLVP